MTKTPLKSERKLNRQARKSKRLSGQTVKAKRKLRFLRQEKEKHRNS